VHSETRDNGGRRWGIERREFSYTFYVPERRRGSERRNVSDRRNGFSQMDGLYGRRSTDRRWDFRIAYEYLSLT
jgi:hypothetical protein